MSQEFYRYHTEREIEEAFRFFDKGTNRIEFRPFLRLLLNFFFQMEADRLQMKVAFILILI